MTRWTRGSLLAALAAVLVACAPPPRVVAPLRTDAAAKADDAPFRQSPPPLPPIAEAPELPPLEKVLASGLRVVLVERHDYPIVAARLVIARSSLDLDDAGGKRVHQMIYLYGRGGDEAAFERASAEAGRSGTTVGGSASPDAITWSVDAPTADLDKAWELLTQRTFGARLTRGEYDRRAAEWTDAQKNRGMSLLNAQADVLFGRSHPYGYASERTMMAFEDAQSLHARLLQPSQATLIVVGDVTPAALEGAMTRWFGNWTATGAPLARRTEVAPAIHGPSLAVVQTRPLEQRPTALFTRGPHGHDEDADAFSVASAILGGIGAALFERERNEMGAAYSVEASFYQWRAASWLSLSAAYDRSKAVQGVKASLEGIRRLRDGEVSEDEVARAKASLLARWRVELATVEGAAQLYESAVTLGTDLDRVAKLPERLAKVGRADVVRVASRYLVPQALHVAFVSEERGYTTESLGMGYEKVLEPAKE